MKIYLDYIFLENIVVNLIVFFIINKFTKINVKKVNLIFGILLISIYYSLLNIDRFNNTIFSISIFKIIIIIISIYVIYFPKRLLSLFKLVIYYIAFDFMYLGIIIALSIIFKLKLDYIIIKLLVYTASAIILYVFIIYTWKMWKSYIHFSDLIYNVQIYGVSFLGFVDTGNMVKDRITNLNVIFIDKNYESNFKNIIQKLDMVNLNLKTVNARSTATGYIARNIVVRKRDKEYIIPKVIISFTENNFSHKKYSALIGYNTYIDDLGGIEFC